MIVRAIYKEDVVAHDITMFYTFTPGRKKNRHNESETTHAHAVITDICLFC